jgi:DNA-binding LacI/PurR family transcriptional regulator
MADRAPILGDVARLAGVSKSTASRILGAPPGRRIPFAADTQDKVRQAAERLGYTPSRLARGLSRDRTGIVGLVIPSVKDSFFPSVTSEIESRLAEKGYNVILANTGGSSRIERAKIMDLLSWRVDGFVAAPSQGAAGGDVFWELWHRKVPFVLVDRSFPQTPFFSVTTDDQRGAASAVEHLLSLGRTRIARAGGPLDISSNRLRHAGYEDALVARGMKPEPRLAITVAPTLDGGHEAATRVLALTPRPDALFCFSDIVAAGALEEFLDTGVSVPGDVALVGYADLEFSRILRVPLTSVRQPTSLIGRTAAEMILARMEGRPAEPPEIRLPVELIVRASTVLAPASRSEV